MWRIFWARVFAFAKAVWDTEPEMDVERIIGDIEQLEEMFKPGCEAIQPHRYLCC